MSDMPHTTQTTPSSRIRPIWRRLAKRFIGVMTWCLLLVWLASAGHGGAALWLASGSFAALWLWSDYQGQRLQLALLNLESGLATVPSAPGQWGELFYALHRVSRHWSGQLTQAQLAQQRFMQAVQASPNAFVMLDDAGRLEWINAAAQALLGLDAQRDVGQNLAYLLRTPAVHALLDSQRLRESMVLAVNDKTLKIQAFPYGEANTLLLGQDLTELERTDQVRRDFVANVSHELRTPLSVLAGYQELLSDYCAANPQALPADLVQALTHMGQHTQRMRSLTDDLLVLAQLDAGLSYTASLQKQSVASWLMRVQDQTQPLAQQAGLGLVFEAAPPDVNGAQVKGIASELDSALINLISNALRYALAGGTVRVRLGSAEMAAVPCLMVSVVDMGCGIAAEHIPRLTERFYRVSASRSRDSGGTGLGLAIVKHLMLRHHGELRIQSAVGQGSTFSLVLPLA